MGRIAKIIGVVVVLIVVAVAAFALLFNADQFRPRVEAALTKALHRETHIGKLSLSILHGRVEADSLTIADDPAFGSTPFIQAKSVGLQVGVGDLILGHKLNVSGIVISEPVIALIQDAHGVWNYATLGSPGSAGSKAPAADAAPGSASEISIAQLHITGARLTVDKSVLENTDIVATDISQTAAFPFTVTGKVASGGEFRLEGKAGPLPSGDASKTPLQVTLKIQKLKLDPYGMGGILALDGQGSSDGRNLDLSGSARIDQARFAAKGTPAKMPLAVEIALKQNLESHQGTISRGALHVGKADAAFSGTYTLNGPKETINMRVQAKSVPVQEVTALFPALDIQMPAGSSLQGGTLSADLTAAGNAEDPVIAGVVDVADTKLGGFNLGEKLAVIERLAGIPASSDTVIQKLHARFRSAGGGTAIDDLALVLPAVGEVTGAGTVSAAKELNFKMRATVKATGASVGAIPFFVAGTASNPLFRPDAAGIITEELNQHLGGKNIGGVDAGKAVDAIKGIFGRKKQ
jgi:AsmA protein